MDIHIELQAFRLLFPLRTTDWNPYDQDGIAKDRFFRPTHPIHGAEWDIVVPLFHSMDYTPFDNYLIIIESLLRLLPPNYFRSIPRQRYQFSPRLLAYLKKVSVIHLANATPPSSNNAQNLAFRSNASSDADPTRKRKIGTGCTHHISPYNVRQRNTLRCRHHSRQDFTCCCT